MFKLFLVFVVISIILKECESTKGKGISFDKGNKGIGDKGDPYKPIIDLVKGIQKSEKYRNKYKAKQERWKAKAKAKGRLKWRDSSEESSSEESSEEHYYGHGHYGPYPPYPYPYPYPHDRPYESSYGRPPPPHHNRPRPPSYPPPNGSTSSSSASASSGGNSGQGHGPRFPEQFGNAGGGGQDPLTQINQGISSALESIFGRLFQ